MPTPEALFGTLVRFAWLAGMVLAVGAVALRELVLSRLSTPAWPGVMRRLALRTATVGMAGAITVLMACFGRLWLQLEEVKVPDSPVTVELVRLLVLGTTWGKILLIQAGMALVGWRAFSMARNDFRVAWVLATITSAGIALLTSFGSHASGTGSLAPLTVAADTIHILTAGAWAGGLATLFAAALWPRLTEPAVGVVADTANGEESVILSLVPRLVAAFSPVALTAAGLLVLTGLVGVWSHVSSPADLYGTNWGRALLIKLAFVGAALTLGAVNWRKVTPALGTPDGDMRLRAMAWFELTAMLLVLLATAVLVALPTPGAEG